MLQCYLQLFLGSKLFCETVEVRSSHQRCSVKKGALRNFAKFPGKYLCRSLFLNKVAGAACNFIKKETLARLQLY